MNNDNEIDKINFLYQRYRYLGKHTPQNFLFNANLQEFSQRVCYLSNLQTLGKISSQECYEEIELLWQQLTQSFKTLIIDEFDVNG
ncbi:MULTISPECIES: DUF7219 family protein [Nostoc]|uniref:DUF7219 family protein n=1 Tax=Nostoc TaxID=1177 RepID=UPI000CF307B0|nr:hypothetical protein [Nostoc sp. 'Peltigera membranacea cyanobiont' N6]AVH64086.1 hypothetical protein NPM_2400 [Nostoc sp. 'Peltigera membranacea cyanobiont' N6]